MISIIETEIKSIGYILINIDENPKMYTKDAKIFYQGKIKCAEELLEKIKKINE